MYIERFSLATFAYYNEANWLPMIHKRFACLSSSFLFCCFVLSRMIRHKSTVFSSASQLSLSPLTNARRSKCLWPSLIAYAKERNSARSWQRDNHLPNQYTFFQPRVRFFITCNYVSFKITLQKNILLNKCIFYLCSLSETIVMKRCANKIPTASL